MNDYWKKEVLIASTLVEGLIVMIISGIIFLSVFEGVGMIRKVTSRMIVRLNSHCGLQEKYFELDGLFRECDSILNQNERLDFYRKGIIHETIGYRDSLLVLTRGEFTDTLFKRVNGWRLVRNGECWVDSLVLWLRVKKGLVELPFTIGDRDGNKETECIREHEKRYDNEK